MADLLRFHVRVYARPAVLTADRPRRWGASQVTPLLAEQSDLLSSWPITFDQAADELGRLPRMFLEPDGSFVWVSSGERAWQVDGVLYDRGPQLAYLELRGSCDPAAFDELLKSLGWPATQFVFELVNEAILLDEADFRLVAGE